MRTKGRAIKSRAPQRRQRSAGKHNASPNESLKLKKVITSIAVYMPHAFLNQVRGSVVNVRFVALASCPLITALFLPARASPFVEIALGHSHWCISRGSSSLDQVTAPNAQHQIVEIDPWVEMDFLPRSIDRSRRARCMDTCMHPAACIQLTHADSSSSALGCCFDPSVPVLACSGRLPPAADSNCR
jgi:hypothetical protein